MERAVVCVYKRYYSGTLTSDISAPILLTSKLFYQINEDVIISAPVSSLNIKSSDADNNRFVPEKRTSTNEQVNELMDNAILIESNRQMLKDNVDQLCLRFFGGLEATFRPATEFSFKATVLCCFIVWLFIASVLLITNISCASMRWWLLGVCALLAAASAVALCEEFVSPSGALSRASAALASSRDATGIFLFCMLIVMAFGSSLELLTCPHEHIGTNRAQHTEITVENKSKIADEHKPLFSVNMATDNPNPGGITRPESPTVEVIQDASSMPLECYEPEYNVLTWMLCLVGVSTLLNVNYLIKKALALIMVLLYWILITLVYRKLFENAHTENSVGNELFMPLYWEMQLVLIVFLVLVAYHARLVEFNSRLDFLWTRQAETELVAAQLLQRTSMLLLQNILPAHVARQFLAQDYLLEGLYHKCHDEIGVIFASIPNFNDLHSRDDEGIQFIIQLHNIIVDFDSTLEEEQFKCIEKIKTIGSTYMAASGLNPQQQCTNSSSKHLCSLLDFALAMREGLKEISDNSLKLRIGISCGPLVSGVIGARRPVYDIWGNTVNEASRMESTGEIDRIQVTKSTSQLLERSGRYQVSKRGLVDVKGKGLMETYWVDAARDDAEPVRRRPHALRRTLSCRSFVAVICSLPKLEHHMCTNKYHPSEQRTPATNIGTSRHFVYQQRSVSVMNMYETCNSPFCQLEASTQSAPRALLSSAFPPARPKAKSFSNKSRIQTNQGQTGTKFCQTDNSAR